MSKEICMVTVKGEDSVLSPFIIKGESKNEIEDYARGCWTTKFVSAVSLQEAKELVKLLNDALDSENGSVNGISVYTAQKVVAEGF